MTRRAPAYLVRRWIALTLVSVLVAGVAAYLYTVRQPSTYQATATLYVQSPTSPTVAGVTDVQTRQALIPTYSQIVRLPIIAHAVDRSMALRYPGYHLGAHSLSVGPSGAVATQSDSLLIDITVSDTLPTRAAASANSVASVVVGEVSRLQQVHIKGGQAELRVEIGAAQRNIQDIAQQVTSYTGPPAGLVSLQAQLNASRQIYQRLVAISLTGDTNQKGVKLLSGAETPTSAIGPHPRNNALLFGVIALLACVGLLYLRERLDDSVRTSDDVENCTGAAILGTVPKFRRRKRGEALLTSGHESYISEAYRAIRTNLQFASPAHTVLVTSVAANEGKTTTVSNLATVCAEARRRVVLVDADLRRPRLHQIFPVDDTPGLSTILLDWERLGDNRSPFMTGSYITVIPSGPVPPHPADLLASGSMQGFVRRVRDEADIILFDSPPVLSLTDASVLSAMVDGVILVVDMRITKRREIAQAREAIEAVGGKILGVVVNRLRARDMAAFRPYPQPGHYRAASVPQIRGDAQKSDVRQFSPKRSTDAAGEG